jgi:hypothetical protein
MNETSNLKTEVVQQTVEDSPVAVETTQKTAEDISEVAAATPEVVETDENQEARAKVEAQIADLEQADRLATALEKVGFSTIDALKAASQDPALKAWKKSIAKQLPPQQLEQLSQEIKGVQSPTDSSKNKDD